MAIKLAEAAHCEHSGSYGYESNHQVGNQTGDELRQIAYYNLPWQYVYRCDNEKIAANIALRQKNATLNMHIGYSQPNRNSYWVQMAQNNYDPAKITVDCDCDCSMLTNTSVQTAFMANGVSTNIQHTLVTAQMPAAYNADPHFTNVTSSINLATGEGLKVGDVLVTPGKHTAVCIEAPSSSIVVTTYNKTPKWVGSVCNCTTTPVYADANATSRLAAWPTLGVTNLVDVCEEVGNYYYIRIAGKYFGFIGKQYLKSTSAAATVQQSSSTKTGTVTTTLNCRAGASTNYAILFVLPEGAKVTILSTTSNNWYQVSYNGKTGYCSAKYIK